MSDETAETLRTRGGRLSGLAVESLRWTMSLFCAFFGAFVLIAPHHFMTAPYVALLPHATFWGALALGSGMGLPAVSVFQPRRWISVLVHGALGLTLVALAVSFAWVRGVSGAIAYSVLGLGTVLAGLRSRDGDGERGGDLFGLLMGFVATLVGLAIVTLPGLFRPPAEVPHRSYLPGFGVALVLAGALLAYCHLAPPLKRGLRWRIHLVAGVVLIGFGAFFALPSRAWTGVALYCVGGAVVAFLPWVGRWLREMDTSSLRTRLSLVLAVSSSLALILATAVVTAQEERLAEEQALATQRIEAQAIAQNVQDYIEMNGARTFAVAALAGQTPMTPEDQSRLLAASRASYPEVTAFRTLRRDGRTLAGSGAVLFPPGLLPGVVAEMRREPRPGVRVFPATVENRSLLLLAAPLREASGRLAGGVIAAFDAEALARRISRRGSIVTLADGWGRQIASRRELVAGDGQPPSLPPGWDRRVRAGRRIAPRHSVAGFAVVPQLDWVVAVERPREDALAGVRRGRDFAFGLLLLVVPLAAVGGIVTARRIARPLAHLSSAVDELTAGNLAAPLGPISGVAEVARLAAAFREMRDRLAARTREGERLAAELRARAEVLAETDRRKDEFLAMLAHELRNPLGAIANASYLLEQLGPTEPQMERAVAIIRRQIQHLVRMVDDLLDVSRITRGKIELRREPLDLVDVVQNAVETSRPLSEAKSQTLQVKLPTSGLPLDGDATRLEQVLTNLLRNAVKFTEPGGRIEISAGCDGGAEAVVRVRDDGIGIAPDLLPRVFDLFAQGEQALDRAGAGLGIGLTLVRSLVEMHGGRVEARSDGPGKGSEIVVRLPLSAHSPAPSALT